MTNIIKRAYYGAFAPWQQNWDATAPHRDMITGERSVPRVRGIEPVNQDSALSLGTVFRAVQIISNAISQMDTEVYRAEEPIKAPGFIKRPNVDEPLPHFLEETCTALALTGNAYWLVYRNKAGNVNNIKCLNPNLVVKEIDDKTGRIRFSYNGKYYTTQNMKHLKLMRVPGYPYGLGPIQYLRAEMQNALDLRSYQSNWFTESGVPTGVLKTEQPLSEDWANEYKKRWEEAMYGYDRTAVLGNGISFQSTYLNPRDAMFIDAVQFTNQALARAFGLPNSLLSLPIDGNSQTYSNVRDENSQFLRYTLSLYTNEIENAFSELLPNGQKVKMDSKSLLALNQFDRYQAHAIAIESGWKSRQEVRTEEGLTGPPPEIPVNITDTTLGNTPTNNAKKETKNES